MGTVVPWQGLSRNSVLLPACVPAHGCELCTRSPVALIERAREVVG